MSSVELLSELLEVRDVHDTFLHESAPYPPYDLRK